MYRSAWHKLCCVFADQTGQVYLPKLNCSDVISTVHCMVKSPIVYSNVTSQSPNTIKFVIDFSTYDYKFQFLMLQKNVTIGGALSYEK